MSPSSDTVARVISRRDSRDIGTGRSPGVGDQTAYFQYSRDGKLLYTNDLKTSLRHNHVYLAGSLVAKRTVPFSGGAATITYQHTDALGSPVAETDEAGAVIRRERLTAYGEPADGSYQNGPGFTGHPTDAATGLSYMQQRYYDPVVGRFISADPVATDPGTGAMFNRYNYANNNPYTYVDPDGRIACKSTFQCYGVSTISINSSKGRSLPGPSVNGQSSGSPKPATPPANPKVEGSGFNSADDAQKDVATKLKDTMNGREYQLMILRDPATGKWQWLTPGYGPKWARVVDPKPVWKAYQRAGLLRTGMVAGTDWHWSHGHWGANVLFSTTDFSGPWNQGYTLYLGTTSGASFALDRAYLQNLADDLSRGWQTNELRGLEKSYSSGLSGRPLE